MTADTVITIIQLLTTHRIGVHIDGGWAVDALLAKQTRPHTDLDIAVEHKDVPKLRELLKNKGYEEIYRDDSWECNFVLEDNFGHQIDVHSYSFDAEGKHIYGVPYPSDSLSGTGLIQKQEVNCISAEWLVKFHTGYELDWDDYYDVQALCKHFNLELPSEYLRFQTKTQN